MRCISRECPTHRRPRARDLCVIKPISSTHSSTLTKIPVTHSQQLHPTNVLVRNPQGSDAARSLYLVNGRVKFDIVHNDHARMYLMMAGTKVITKQAASRRMDAQFHILGGRLPVVLSYLEPGTIMTVGIGVLVLQTYYPLYLVVVDAATLAYGKTLLFET